MVWFLMANFCKNLGLHMPIYIFETQHQVRAFGPIVLIVSYYVKQACYVSYDIWTVLDQST